MTPSNEARPAETGDWFLRNANRRNADAFIHTDPKYFADECAAAIMNGTLTPTPDKPVDLGADAERGALLPCPFCGESAVFGKTEWGSAVAGCLTENCPAERGAYDYVSDETAAAHWNQRTPPASVNAAIERNLAHLEAAWDAEEKWEGDFVRPSPEAARRMAEAMIATPTHPDQEGGE